MKEVRWPVTHRETSEILIPFLAVSLCVGTDSVRRRPPVAWVPMTPWQKATSLCYTPQREAGRLKLLTMRSVSRPPSPFFNYAALYSLTWKRFHVEWSQIPSVENFYFEGFFATCDHCSRMMIPQIFLVFSSMTCLLPLFNSRSMVPNDRILSFDAQSREFE